MESPAYARRLSGFVSEDFLVVAQMLHPVSHAVDVKIPGSGALKASRPIAWQIESPPGLDSSRLQARRCFGCARELFGGDESVGKASVGRCIVVTCLRRTLK
jgi:hypothetical protein